tara:strand:+ start:373 stop:693 length:321 start_codon:yes stop_codon:yes gene_type:complete
MPFPAEQKFSVVVATASLTEVELNEYCRPKGLYPDQVRQWKSGFINGNQAPAQQPKEQAFARRADQRCIKELEKELRRKSAALAETAALLILRKKLNAYWGQHEDN